MMESLACGIVVGFNVGGIPEMMEYQVNGHSSKCKDSRSLAEGIE